MLHIARIDSGQSLECHRRGYYERYNHTGYYIWITSGCSLKFCTLWHFILGLRATFITWDADTEGFNKKQDMGIKDEEKTLKMP